MRLGDRQRIHVCAQRYYLPRTSAANKRRDNSGDGNLLSDLTAKLAQVLCNQASGTDFSIAKLWILMNIPSPSDHFARNRCRIRIELAVDGACRCGYRLGCGKTSKL